jgi:hypothetical protein
MTLQRLDCALARRPIGLALFAGFVVLWALLTKVHTHSWQEESRMATVQAVVEQGTFTIDHTAFNRTGDKVFIHDHFYSDKTPLLSVGAAGTYWILHHVFGLTLDSTICVPDEDAAACRAFTPTGTRFTAFYWLTLIWVGGSSALLVALFWRAMIDRGAGGRLATALAMALGLASPIAPYSIVFAGHVPAALALFAGFWLLLKCPPDQPPSGHTRRSAPAPSGPPVHRTGHGLARQAPAALRRQDADDPSSAPPPVRVQFRTGGGREGGLFWSGLLISLAANIDLTLALFVAAFGLWVLIAHRVKVIAFAVGASIPFALSAIVNYWAAGTLAPLYLDPKAYDFLGTVLNPTAGGTNGFYSLDFGVRYAYNLLIGERGVFAFTPMLIFGLIGAAWVSRQRTRPERGLTLALLSGCGAFAAYLIARTDNYGGAAWGARWFAPLAPLLWFYLRDVWCGVREGRGAWAWRVLMVAALVMSLLTAVSGLHDAWRVVPPIVRL